MLADRWGRRATLLAAHLAAAGLMAALAFTRPLLLIALLAALVGVVALDAQPGVRRGDRRRGARGAPLARVQPQFWAFNLGMAVASLLAGVLAEASFIALFLVDAGATLAAAAVIAWKVPETLAGPASGRPTAGHGAAPRSVRTRRPGLRTALTDRISWSSSG